MRKICLGTILMLGLSPLTFAFDNVPELEKQYEEVNDIEVITVTGERHLGFFRQQMRNAEDSFFSLYNSLTDEDEYKINCSRKDHLGTNVVNRICEPQYVSDMKFEEIQVALKSGSSHASGAGMINSGRLAKKMGNRSSNAYYVNLFKKKRKEHLKNVEKLVLENPELKKKLVELNLARDALQRKKIEEFGDDLAGKHTMTTVIEDQ